ncbi:MAG TPA: tetratricopeptide repeat protein [Planctomycetota bacterium]|nr:tetratricopeptide repeat protein [Planctomycetota bacterium]
MTRAATNIHCLGLLLLALVYLCPAQAHAREFVLRQYDEVYFKDGSTARGVLIDTDREDEKKIRNVLTNTVRSFNVADVKEIRRRATPETELERLSKQYAGRPEKIRDVAVEAMENLDPALTPKLIAMLEKEAGGKAPDILALLAQLYLQSGQATLALKHAETLVGVAPNGKSLMLRGKAYQALGRMEQADKDLEQATKLLPENQEVAVARADFLLQAGRPEEAKNMFSGALFKNNKNTTALVGQGLVLLRQGEYADAEKCFKEALFIDTRHKQAELGLAATKIMLKQYDEAYAEARQALNIDNKCAEAFALQAFARLFLGTPESLKDFYSNLKNALDEKPNQPRLLLAHAVALEREARFLEAQGTPESLKEAKAKRDESNVKYTELANSDPADSYLQYLIGERRFRIGDYAGAEKAFLRTVQLAPNYAPAHAALGAVSLRLGKWEKAKDAYTAAIQIDPKSKAAADYYAGRGLAWLKVKVFEEAAASLKQARELDRRNVMALCGLGYIANGEKNKESAIEFFQQALAADGSSEYAADALRKIFAQENMNLEYVTFNDGNLPMSWKFRTGGMVKPSVLNGQVLFAGVQGSAAGTKVEVYKDIKADDFVRFEADLDIAPTSQATFGLRLASATNVATSFEMEFAKDETNELKVRFKDYGGNAPQWQSVKTEWPPEGRVRLGLDTDDLKGGKIGLWINGKKAGELKLILQRPTRMIVGAYVQAPPKEDVTATVDNIVLVTRGPAVNEREGGDALQLNKEDEKKPAEQEKKQ